MIYSLRSAPWNACEQHTAVMRFWWDKYQIVLNGFPCFVVLCSNRTHPNNRLRNSVTLPRPFMLSSPRKCSADKWPAGPFECFRVAREFVRSHKNYPVDVCFCFTMQNALNFTT